MANQTFHSNNPTAAQIAAMRGSQGAGTQRYAQYQDNSLWASGLTMQEVEKVLAFNSLNTDGEDFLHCLSMFFGPQRSRGIGTEEFMWREFDKFRYGITVATVVSGEGTDTVIVEDSTDEQRLIVGRTLQTPRVPGVAFIITAVDTATNPAAVRYTLQKLTEPPAVIAAGEIQVNDVLGNYASAFGEGTDQPEGQKWFPLHFNNRLGIVKATQSYTGSALTTKMIDLKLPNGLPPLQVRLDWWNTFREFKRDRENVIAWGHHSGNGDGPKQGDGMIPLITSEAVSPVEYTGALAETDILQIFNNLHDKNPGDHYLWLGGYDQMEDAALALKEYHLNGAVKYGEFGDFPNLSAGLGVTQYWFGTLNKSVTMKNYKQFSDPEITGSAGVATASIIDYRHFGVILNMGQTTRAEEGTPASFLGQTGPVNSSMAQNAELPYFTVFHKEAGGVNRSFWMGRLSGMTGSRGGLNVNSMYGDVQMPNPQLLPEVATGVDEDRLFLAAEVGCRIISARHAHTTIRQNAQ